MELADATVLIGAPASGKSNILDAIAFAGYFHRFRVLGEEYGNDVHFLEPLMSIARFSDPRNLFPFYDISQDIAISVTGEANVRCVARFEHGSVEVYINGVDVPSFGVPNLILGMLILLFVIYEYTKNVFGRPFAILLTGNTHAILRDRVSRNLL
jgi:hypothetical protein